MITRTITYTVPDSEPVTIDVDLHSADLVNDMIKTSVGYVPYEWHVEFTKDEVDTAIQNYLEGNPNVVESNGIGFIVHVADREVEVTNADYTTNYLNFKWRSGSPYKGDCAIAMQFTADTTTADILSAINSLIQ